MYIVLSFFIWLMAMQFLPVEMMYLRIEVSTSSRNRFFSLAREGLTPSMMLVQSWIAGGFSGILSKATRQEGATFVAGLPPYTPKSRLVVA